MGLLQKNDFVGNPFQSREDVEKGLKALLDPILPHASAGGAEYALASTVTHYDHRAVSLETFARPLWGLTALLLGGGEYDHVDNWVKGLASGTDPDGEEYWQGSRAKDQRMVEMSPLSFAIALKPDVFYTPQSEQTKKNIEAFLQTCIGKPMPDTNWLWFRVFSNLALRTVSSPLHNAQQMVADLERLDSFQFPDNETVEGDPHSRSAGWTNDGPKDVWQRDYYSSSFAITVAMLVYAKICAKSDPERAAAYRKRVQDFCLDFVYYFSDEGPCIAFGRSMIYRFACVATFSALALSDTPPPAPLEWGHVKGIVLRHLESWGRNADMFRSDGTLTIGYGYDNWNMAENYNAPGSPYWCTKAFLCLAAPSSHPFWTSEALPWPTALFPPLKALPDPSHILSRHASHAFLLSSGQHPHYALRAGPAKYSKFAYSSAFGFSCPTGDMAIEQVAADSMLALLDESACDGETWRVRRVPVEPRLVGRGTPRVHLRSGWQPWPDVSVETWLIPPQQGSEGWYTRVHKITTGRPLKSSEGGWATFGQSDLDGRALIQAFSGEISEGGLADAGTARAVTKGGAVGVLDLEVKGKRGLAAKRQGSLVQSDSNSNVVFSRSVLPSLLADIPKGESWIAVGVFGVPGDYGMMGARGEGWRKEWEAKWEEGIKALQVPSWVLEE